MTTTRFAPSPTGYLHIGNLRAAGIKDDLTWLGIDWDQIEHQSQRMDRYEAAKQKLIDMGRLYECFETPTELDLKRKKQLNMGKPPVYDRAALALSEDEKNNLRAERGSHWRFKLDHERIEWTDGIIGDISIDASSVSDPVLFKNDGQILYTLASVVDDTEMGMTDVVRGSDHVTNTATQIQMIRTLGGTVPRFIAPQAILSLMARLGSSDPVELRSNIKEVVDGFDISKFGSAPTKFDAEDLKPLTARHLGTRSSNDVADVLTSAGVPDDLHNAFWNVVHDNINTLDDVAEWWAMFRDGATPLIEDEDRDFIAQAFDMLPALPYAEDTWSTWTAAVKEATGRKGKQLFMPLFLVFSAS